MSDLDKIISIVREECGKEREVRLSDRIVSRIEALTPTPSADQPEGVKGEFVASCVSCDGTGDQGGNPSYGVCEDCDGSGKSDFPTPASADQMEVVAWRIGHKFEDDYIVWTYFDGSDEVDVEKAIPLVKAQALSDARAEIERLTRELDGCGKSLADEVECRLTAEARLAQYEEALKAERLWHEEKDKALSKQPPTIGPRGNQWERLEHQERIAEIDAALSSKESRDEA